MAYLLLLTVPFVMSIATFILRRAMPVTVAIAVATLLTHALLTLQLPVDAPARLLGLTIALDPLGRLCIVLFDGVVAAALLAALGLPHGENYVSVALLMVGFSGATLLFLQEPFVVALLLVSASICSVLAIVDLPTGSPTLVGTQALATGLRYLVLVVLAGVVTYLASVLASITPAAAASQISSAHLVLGLLVVGFGLRLALVPFHAWLPDLVADAAPMVSVTVVLVNVAGLLVLIAMLQFSPQVVLENSRGLLIVQWIGGVTALVGGAFALLQRELRRVIGYLLVFDTGVLLCGLASVTALGMAGAIFQAFNQAVVTLALLLAVALLERPDDRPANVVRRDLLRRWPVAGAGLIAAAAALIGVPPFAGFVGKLMVYYAVAQRSPALLAVLLAGTLLALLAVGRMVRDRLIGPSEDWPVNAEPVLLGTTELDRPVERRLTIEPRGLALLLTALIGAQLAVGLYPQPVVDTITAALRNLTFVRPL